MRGPLLRELGVGPWAPLCVLALFLVLGSPSLASTPVTPATLAPHAPIVIDGDNSFTSPNGVIRGTGAATDPFVIEGWLINATSSDGITIRNTSAHLVIRNLAIEASSPNFWGVYFDFASNAIVENVSTRGKAGVSIWSSSDIMVRNSEVGGQTGVALYSSSLVTIKGNNISHTEQGIVLDGANNTIVANNTITWSGTFGLLVSGSSKLSVVDNDISSNGWAGASFDGTTDSSIARNRFSNNGHTRPGQGAGLVLSASLRFQVDHNDFLSNEIQAVDMRPGMNRWNASYPLGGNHWSDYPGEDRCSGPAQDLCQSPDGFGDKPYPINGSAEDRYPRMHAAVDTSPPTVVQILVTGSYVADPITVSAVVTDPSGVTRVILWLKGIGQDHFDATPMQPQGGGAYRAEIPPQNRSGTVQYHIIANDRWGNEVRDPPNGEHETQIVSLSEPGGAGPGGMDANTFGVLVAVPAGIFGAMLLVAWLRSRRH